MKEVRYRQISRRAPAYNASMEIIYVDSLFLLNLAIDYLLLSCTAAVCGLTVKRLRYFAGALIGAAYSAAVHTGA